MPIFCPVSVRDLARKEFGILAYEVMADIFAIRNELGRFFDESVYKQALATRRTDALLEVPVDVVFRDFRKRYLLDVMLASSCVIEFKAADALTDRHRAQLLHYLFLLELQHGLLINVRPEHVEREFINAVLTRADRCGFSVMDTAWDLSMPGATQLRDILLVLLAEWGTALELPLYEAALTHIQNPPRRRREL